MTHVNQQNFPQQSGHNKQSTNAERNKQIAFTRETSDAVDLIFGTMPGMWPQFISTYGTNDTTGSWKTALQGIPLPLVKQALKRYTRAKGDFPPTPGQFYNACIEIRRVEQSRHNTADKTSDGSFQPKTEKQKAMYACRWHLTHRLIGDLARAIPKPKEDYIPKGFPMRQLVWGVELRDPTKAEPYEVKEIEGYHRLLAERFREAWGVYTENKNSG